jgi:tRNA G18 (ribose-2'-O)-methylase SpoU
LSSVRPSAEPGRSVAWFSTQREMAMTRRRARVALVLGNEEHGLAPEVAAACEQVVTIPGSGAVESLNVSAAAAVLCWEFFGRH